MGAQNLRGGGKITTLDNSLYHENSRPMLNAQIWKPNMKSICSIEWWRCWWPRVYPHSPQITSIFYLLCLSSYLWIGRS